MARSLNDPKNLLQTRVNEEPQQDGSEKTQIRFFSLKTLEHFCLWETRQEASGPS